MAKGFKAGGGGGNPLNFKVVINPQPETAKENTIWVNTDIPIPSWHFTATQPENMTEGDVWFPTGTSSPVEFNALKKNSIQVYPLSAKQYVGGSLVDKTMQIYQDGEWTNLENYLYKNGDQYSAKTGGWTSSNWLWGDTPDIVTTPKFNSDHIYIYGVDGVSAGIIGTKNKVDLSNYTTLNMEYTCSAANATTALSVDSAKQGYIMQGDSVANVALKKSTTVTTISLPIAAIDGSYYIHVSADYNSKVKIYRIWLV